MPTVVRIQVAREIPEADCHELLRSFDNDADVSREHARGAAPDPEWITFVADMKDVGAVAGATASVLKLADQLLAWRDRLRQKGANPSAVLDAPGRQKLDLASAADTDVRAWLAES